MTKNKFCIEYMMNTASQPIIWEAISTPLGLQSWLAEEVTAEEKIYTFRWSEDEVKQAELTHLRNGSFVRFHWLEDEDPKSYFEFRINQNELTGDYTLLVTDFAENAEEEEELRELWDFEVNILQRNCGI